MPKSPNGSSRNKLTWPRAAQVTNSNSTTGRWRPFMRRHAVAFIWFFIFASLSLYDFGIGTKIAQDLGIEKLSLVPVGR